MIFPARRMYFNLNVLICCRYSVPFAKYVLNEKTNDGATSSSRIAVNKAQIGATSRSVRLLGFAK
jgi:hypothetical protein